MKTFADSVWSGLALLVLPLASSAAAQCPEWNAGLHVNGTDQEVFALAAFDFGSGPQLYAGGQFGSANGVSANNIAVWDGSAWVALGSGLEGTILPSVSALERYDDGSGPALYAAGYFALAGGVSAASIAKWDGLAWSPLGSGIDGSIFDLAVFDDGTGAALYAAGAFDTAGGLSANNIAKWDGVAWTPLGLGLEGGGYTAGRALAVYDDGSGAALYAAGTFTNAGGVFAPAIARWDGSTWTPVGTGMNDDVRALTVLDDGGGPQLYAAGPFDTAGGVPVPNLARWDGSTWSPYGASLTSGSINTLIAYDDGSGAALYAAGGFQTGASLEVKSVAKWSGSQWLPLSTGTVGYVFALTPYDDGSGERLVAGGEYTVIGDNPANNVATWNGSTWAPIGDGGGLNGTVFALVPFDDGNGPALYVGGGFTVAGITASNGIAKWDGSAWTPLSSGVASATAAAATVQALAVFDDGTGPALYAGGRFASAGGVDAASIAKWDGSTWSPLGSGVGGPSNAQVNALAVFDDGTGAALYAGGNFTTAGGAPASRIARWDGSAWTALGAGIDGMPSFIWIETLAVYDDGTGSALYAGGAFNTAGGNPATFIAKWDGSTWSSVGGGTNHTVMSLAVFDDGTGPGLYAGGFLTAAGGVPAAHVARWDGTTWSALGGGVTGQWSKVESLTVFDDGSGPALVVGGLFSLAGSVSTNGIAKWNGSAWSALGAGLSWAYTTPPQAFALSSFEDSSGRALYVGGLFTNAGNVYGNFIAAWSACPGAGIGVPFCFGDAGGVGCPCMNLGLAGHGCDNSAATGGAILTGSGNASLNVDTVQLQSSGELPSVLSVVVQGDADLAQPVVFGDGMRCVGGNLKRLYAKNAVGGVVVAPTGAELSISARSAALGDLILAGETRSYQVYYRDPSAAFCPAPVGDTFNVSQALRILWTP